MRTQTSFIEYKGARLHYVTYGHGPAVLLAFHGYGQSHEAFACLQEAWGEEYTIYSFDLFFHQDSYWPFKEEPLRKEFLSEMLLAFLQQEKIARFSVMGYSMGGKFALTAVQMMPEKIDALFLLAADGVDTSFWYTLATWPKTLRAVFKRSVFKPDFFFKSLDFMGRTRIVNKSLLRFSASQMSGIKNRRRVYLSWVVFRKLMFSMKKIARLIVTHHIKTIVFIGKHDKVITVRNMKKLTEKLPDAQMHILNTGHHTLIQKVAEFLKDNH